LEELKKGLFTNKEIVGEKKEVKTKKATEKPKKS